MERTIDDSAAIAFGATFYRAIGQGHPVVRSFDIACAALEFYDNADHRSLHLFRSAPDSADPIFLIPPVLMPPPPRDPVKPSPLPPVLRTGKRVHIIVDLPANGSLDRLNDQISEHGYIHQFIVENR